MNWKKILKMPMPINARADRDEQYRQKIIDYEKNTIEPAITQYVSKTPAAENQPFKIYFHWESTDRGLTDVKPKGLAYGIGTTKTFSMGDNKQFILGVIKDVYEKEGYKVSLDAEEIKITQ